MHKEPLWELDLEASRLCERVKKSRGASEAKGRSAGDLGGGPSLPPSPAACVTPARTAPGGWRQRALRTPELHPCAEPACKQIRDHTHCSHLLLPLRERGVLEFTLCQQIFSVQISYGGVVDPLVMGLEYIAALRLQPDRLEEFGVVSKFRAGWSCPRALRALAGSMAPPCGD